MTMTAVEHPCPKAGCLIFPYDNAEALTDHVESGAHVFAEDIGRRRFETVPNGWGGTTTRRVEPITPPTNKQTAFVRSLLAERTGIEEAEGVRQALNLLRERGILDRKAVSKAIDSLLKIERPKPEPTETPEPRRWDPSKGSLDRAVLEAIPAGRYLADDTFLQVDRPAKGRWEGFIFVKLIRNISGSFEATRRVALLNPESSAARIDEAFRLAVETLASDPKACAVAFGMKTGSCCRCGRTLTDPRSIELGIGPVCLRSFG